MPKPELPAEVIDTAASLTKVRGTRPAAMRQQRDDFVATNFDRVCERWMQLIDSDDEAIAMQAVSVFAKVVWGRNNETRMRTGTPEDRRILLIQTFIKMGRTDELPPAWKPLIESVIAKNPETPAE